MATPTFETPAFERGARLAAIRVEVEQFLQPYAARMDAAAFDSIVSGVPVMRLEDEQVAVVMRSGSAR